MQFSTVYRVVCVLLLVAAVLPMTSTLFAQERQQDAYAPASAFNTGLREILNNEQTRQQYLERLSRGEIIQQSGTVPTQQSPMNVSLAPDVLVNNNNGGQADRSFIQSESDVIAFGNTVIVVFNDAGSYTGSNNQFTGWARSTDGGATFIDGGTLPPSAIGDAGDPVIARHDASGMLYFSTLGFSSPGTIQMFRSSDDGATWMAPTVATPGGSSEDKQWHCVDNFPGPGNGNVYMISRNFGSGSGIYLYRSTDQGATFGPSGGVQIVSGNQGAYVTVGSDHAVYAFWYTTGAIMVRKSTDFGVSFGAPVTVASGLVGGTNGDLGLTGRRQGLTTFSSFRSNEFPHATVNPVTGSIYVTYNNKGAGTDKADIFFVQSTNGGASWSAPFKVNDDATTTDQWQPTLAVSPSGTQLGIFYYSRQEEPDSNNRFKYYGRIANISGGNFTWQPSFAISDVASLPEFGRDAVVNSVYMSDYTHAYATPAAFHVCWSDNRDDYAPGPPRKDPNMYYEKIPTTQDFGWVKGVVTNTNGGAPVSNVNIDFVEGAIQVGSTTDATGFYRAGARVDSPATTLNLTLRARKFGFLDSLVAVTIVRNDTITRDFQMTAAPGGTLSVWSHTATANLRSYVEVKFGTQVVINDSTDATTGLLTAPLPIGTYSVKVDAPAPYLTRNFPSVVINNGATTNVDALTQPVVTNSPVALRDTLPVGGQHNKTLTLTNTSPDSVPYRLSSDEALLKPFTPGQKAAIERSTTQQTSYELKKGEFGTDAEPAIPAGIDGHGGPDAFGYTWIDSDDPGGPTFNWTDISGLGTQITTWTGSADDGYATVALPFSFPFYGSNYNSMNVVTNGFVQFGGGTSTAFTNGAIPSTAVPNNAIYPFWDDLDLRTSGSVHYYNDVANGRFILQWTNAPHFSSGGPYTYQMILKPTGEILCQYLDMQAPLNSATIGIENATGTVALQVVFNADYLHNNLALLFKLRSLSWMTLNPSAGVLAPNSDQNITATFDASGLTPGTNYNGNVFVDVTHPDAGSTITVPASLRVVPVDSALAVFAKNTVSFQNVQINTTKRDTNTVRNVGNSPLSISSITTTNAKFVVTPASGTIAPGDSLKMIVAYTPTTVTTNDTGRVVFLSNSQGTPRKDVTLTGTSIGAPAISVSVTSIADTMQVGQSHSKTFTMTNTTPAPSTPLVVSITDSATWLNVTPASDTLAATQTKTYTTAFNATGLTVGTYTTNIRIASNDPADPLKIVAATLRVVGGPIISTRPDSTVKSLAAGASGVDSFYIKNTGVSTLTWNLAEVPAGALDNRPGSLTRDEKQSIERSTTQQASVELAKDAKDTRSEQRMSPDGQGGPDAFGYRWIDSDEPGGPQYNWAEIKGVGTQITTWSGSADDGYATVALPFTFSFYGNDYSSINVVTNGFVQFGGGTSTAFTNGAIPSTAVPNNAIYPFWDDLNFGTTSGGSGTCWYYNDAANQRFIVQWDSVGHYSTSGFVGTYWFQMILHADGRILCQYKQMVGELASATIGIENSTGTVALQTVFNAAYVHDNLALLFSKGIPWLDETPTSGTVNPGDSAKVRLNFDAAGLTAGTYRGILTISSNDFAHNPLNYVVRLNVTGGASTVTVTSPNGGEQWVRGSSYPITWTQTNVDTVKIEFSTTGSGGPYTLITGGVPARPTIDRHPKLDSKDQEGGITEILGTYNWTIPAGTTPSTNCYVRISQKSNASITDISNAAFSILASTPAETSWTVQTSPTTQTLYAVKTISQNVAWAGGGAGVVIRTTNAGVNWATTAATSADPIYCISALDANTAMAGSYSSAWAKIWKTTNGGTSWQVVDSVAGSFPNAVHMFDANTAYWQGDPVGSPLTWVLRKTTNGGTSWANAANLVATPSSEAGWNNSMQWMDANNGWFGTNSSHAYRTTDGGATWIAATHPTVNSYSLWFNSMSMGVLGGGSATNRSTDAGVTWTASGAISGNVLGMTGMMGSQQFWATPGNATVQYSSDGGATWSTTPPNGYSGTGTIYHVNHVTQGNSLYGWAVGVSGAIRRFVRTGPNSVENGSDALPTNFTLDQNYPNPFNPTTTISYGLPTESYVSLKVYNLLGQEVATLVDGMQTAAFHHVQWTGQNSSGLTVPSGLYFFRLDATPANGREAQFTQIRKMIMMK
jgi:hypothetical protein